MVLLIALLGIACVVDSAILYRDSRDVVQDDLEVTGTIYNSAMWSQIDALQTPSGNCSLEACSGNGICTQTNTTRICICNEGFCGPTCATSNTMPISYVSASRPTASTGQIVFAPHHCTAALTTGDSVQLVKGTCQTPTTIMRTLTNPTISSLGYATFAIDVSTPTALFQPMVVCYKLNGSTVYNTVKNAPFALPCTTGTDYVCPTTGLCVASCTTCTSGYTFPYVFTRRLCLKNAAPTGTIVRTTAFACGACGGSSTPEAFFDSNTATNGQCTTTGECAVFLDFTVDWVFFAHNVFPKSGDETKAWFHHIMYFNSSVPPLPADNYNTLASKAILNFADYDQFYAVGTSHDYSASPPVARYGMLYRKPAAAGQLLLADVRFLGYTYN